MNVLVGLDCGGSSSRVLAINPTGKVLFQGQSGAANLVATPESRLRRNLRHAVEGCPKATHVCGCFAGLVSEETRRFGTDVLRELFPDAMIRAEADFVAALYASEPGTDVCVIAGTGSLVCSRGACGIVKSGGRGYILGDPGSGYHYGKDALNHFLDEPGDATPFLRDEVFRLFGTLDEGNIVAKVYHASPPSTLLARLLKALGSDARAGEPYAVSSIQRNSRNLVDTVVSHIERNFPERRRLTISVAGGVWQAGGVFRDEFERQLRERLSDLTIVVQRVTKPPVYGAVELAREMSHGNGG